MSTRLLAAILLLNVSTTSYANEASTTLLNDQKLNTTLSDSQGEQGSAIVVNEQRLKELDTLLLGTESEFERLDKLFLPKARALYEDSSLLAEYNKKAEFQRWLSLKVLQEERTSRLKKRGELPVLQALTDQKAQKVAPQQENLSVETAITNKTSENKKEANKLAYLGYVGSRLLFTEQKTSYYLARSQNTKFCSVVAIHDVKDDEQILDMELGRDADQHPITFQLSLDTMKSLTRLKDVIAGHLSKDEVSCTNTAIINHYTASHKLFNTEVMKRRSAGSNVITPILITNLIKGNDNIWYSKGAYLPYSKHNDYPAWEVFHSGEAATLNDAIKGREVLNVAAKKANMPEAERKAEEQSRIAEKDKARSEEAKRLGLVYRPLSYWSKYQVYGEYFRQIFDGDKKVVTFEGLYPHLFNKFIEAYSNRCRSYIPNGAPSMRSRVDETIFNKSTWGSNTYTIWEEEIFVKPKLWNDFLAYDALIEAEGRRQNRHAIDIIFRNPKRLLEDMVDQANFQLNLMKDIYQLFNNEECGSDFMKQFEENLWRLSNKKPSLQASDK